MVHVSFNKGDAVRRRTLWHIHRCGEFSLLPFYIHKCFTLSLSFYVLIILFFFFFFFFLLHILLLVLMWGYVSELLLPQPSLNKSKHRSAGVCAKVMLEGPELYLQEKKQKNKSLVFVPKSISKAMRVTSIVKSTIMLFFDKSL
jgi:hypothetical protein